MTDKAATLTPEFQEVMSIPHRQKIARLETEVEQLRQINAQLEAAWREERTKRETAEALIVKHHAWHPEVKPGQLCPICVPESARNAH